MCTQIDADTVRHRVANVGRAAVFAGIAAMSAGMPVGAVGAGFADALKRTAPRAGTAGGEGKTAPAANPGDGAQKAENRTKTPQAGQPPAPVKVTVEWQGRKVTVEIPDGGAQAGAARSPAGGGTKSLKPAAGTGAPQTGFAAKLNDKLLNAVKGVIEKSLEGYDAEKAAEEDLKSVMERTQKGLAQMFANLRIAEDAAGHFTVQLPDTSALHLGEGDKLGAIK